MSVFLFVHKCLVEAVLVPVVLYLVVFESLVGSGLKVVCERLEWALDVVAEANFHLFLFVEIIVVFEQKVAYVLLVVL